MKSEGKVWIFFDSETQKESKPLSVVQAQVLLLKFKAKDLHKVYIWTPGWSEWQSVYQLLKSEQKYFVVNQPPRPKGDNTVILPPPPEASGSTKKPKSKEDSPFTQIIVGHRAKSEKIDYGYYAQEFTGEQLDYEEVKKVKPLKTETVTETISTGNVEDDRRRALRHNFKLEIVLINKDGSFRTFSKNISATGTLLQDSIPKSFLNKPFDLVIINRFEPDPQKARLLFKAHIVGDLTNPRRLMFVNVDDSMIARLEALLTAYVHYQQALRKQTG